MKRRSISRAVTGALVMAAMMVITAPPAAADQFIYAEACPEGYRGVIVGYDHPKFGSQEAFVCTNV